MISMRAKYESCSKNGIIMSNHIGVNLRRITVQSNRGGQGVEGRRSEYPPCCPSRITSWNLRTIVLVSRSILNWYGSSSHGASCLIGVFSQSYDDPECSDTDLGTKPIRLPYLYRKRGELA